MKNENSTLPAMYSIYDKKAKVYNTPFLQVNAQVAIRTFEDLANDDKTPLSKHPYDYDLYEIAKWDDSTGELLQQAPEFIASAGDLKKII